MDRIILDKTQSKRVREKFNLNQPTLSNYLNFNRNSKKAVEVRMYAMRFCNGKLLSDKA